MKKTSTLLMLVASVLSVVAYIGDYFENLALPVADHYYSLKSISHFLIVPLAFIVIVALRKRRNIFKLVIIGFITSILWIVSYNLGFRIVPYGLLAVLWEYRSISYFSMTPIAICFIVLNIIAFVLASFTKHRKIASGIFALNIIVELVVLIIVSCVIRWPFIKIYDFYLMIIVNVLFYLTLFLMTMSLKKDDYKRNLLILTKMGLLALAGIAKIFDSSLIYEMLAEIYIDSDDEEEVADAIKYFEHLCDKGDGHAMFRLSMYYRLAGEYEKSNDYLRDAVAHDDEGACFTFASECFFDVDNQPDYANAIKYYSKSAELGGAEGAFRAGACILNWDEESDKSKGIDYIIKAKELGNPLAEFYLNYRERFGEDPVLARRMAFVTTDIPHFYDNTIL